MTGGCLDDAAVARCAIDPAYLATVDHVDGCEQCQLRIAVARAGAESTLAPAPWDDAVAPIRGRAIGRYLALGILGRGGMGVVVAAYDPELDRKVAVKIIGGGTAPDDDTDGPLRLIREAKAMARLSHPNVVPVYDAGTCPDGVFIAMELIEGTTLGRWCSTAHPWPEIVERFVLAGRGLAAAHAEGLVHRDFKPDNVLVAPTGAVKVTDFGLVTGTRLDHPEPTAVTLGAVAVSTLDLTRTGAIMGTPRFMAPEQFAAQAVDARTDQFAFCAALYEALWGTPPFAGASFAELAAAVTAGELRPPPADSRVPNTIRAAVLRGLSRRPEDRHPAMEPLLAALTTRPRRRRWWLAAALAATAGIAVVVVGRGSSSPACALEPAVLDGSWTAEARAQLATRFAAVSPAFGGAAARDASAGLDDYAAAWADARTASCRAQRRGEIDPRTAQRRRACLERRRIDAAALIATLRDPDASAVALAGTAVRRLTPVAACADAEQLGRRPEPPQDQAAAIAALERALADVRAQLAAGHYLAARADLAPIASAAETHRFAPLTLAVELVRSDIARELGGVDEARTAARSAIAIANRLALDDEAVRAWFVLAQVESNAGDLDAAELAASVGYALAVRGDDRALMIELGALAQRQEIARGELTSAAGIGDELEARMSGAAARDWRVRATLAATRAARLHAAGQHDLAYQEATAARTIAVEALGESHPELWNAEFRLASIAFGRGDVDASSRWLASVRRRLTAGAIDGAAVVGVLYNTAILDSELGVYDSAALDRAQSIADRLLPANSIDRLWIVYARGVVAFGTGDLTSASAHFRTVVGEVRGHDRVLEASANENLGKTLALQDDLAGAVAPLTRAIELRELERPASVELARVRSALGRVHLDAGHAALALPLLAASRIELPAATTAQRHELAEFHLYYALALNELERGDEADADVITAVAGLRDGVDRYALGLALFLDADRRARHGDLAGARTAAREAQAHLRAEGHLDQVTNIEQWLARHR